MSDKLRQPRLAAGGFAPARAQNTQAPTRGARQQAQPGDEEETRQIIGSLIQLRT